jgi:hypothetical protein
MRRAVALCLQVLLWSQGAQHVLLVYAANWWASTVCLSALQPTADVSMCCAVAVYLQVLLWSQGAQQVPLVYAASWWASATVDRYLSDRALPIWVSLAKGHLELFREIQMVSRCCVSWHWSCLSLLMPVAQDLQLHHGTACWSRRQCRALCNRLHVLKQDGATAKGATLKARAVGTQPAGEEADRQGPFPGIFFCLLLLLFTAGSLGRERERERERESKQRATTKEHQVHQLYQISGPHPFARADLGLPHAAPLHLFAHASHRTFCRCPWVTINSWSSALAAQVHFGADSTTSGMAGLP